MKKTIASFLIIFAVIISAEAQEKLAIIDKAQFMNAEIEKILIDRLAAESIELTSIVDTKKRCDYWFANLVMSGSGLQLELMDCNDKTAGAKNLGSRIMTASDSEKGLLLYFAISEMLKEPFKNVQDTPKEQVSPPGYSLPTAGITDQGHHKTRYFFAPSSYNLEKGEIYYNSLYFMLHDVQYGISDHFSMGMGTTIFGFPFYLTPKITIPLNEKSAFAIGDMFMIGTYGTKFTGNLLYATYTTGGKDKNITVGGGYLYAGGGDIYHPVNAAVLNLSSLLRISGHVFFITENYGSKLNIWNSVSRYDENTGQVQYSYFKRNLFFIYGLTGFRFVNKTKDIKSWQFGLSYIIASRSEIPAMYNNSWTIDNSSESVFTAFPVIGYARKFSARY